jgi:hypothetical protein
MKITDELRKLANEMDELWVKLEPKIQKFNAEAAKFGNDVGDTLHDDVARAGADLKAQFEKIRDRVK